jgi:hypothetical protein
MNVSAVSPSIPVKPPEANVLKPPEVSVLKPPEVKLDRDDTRTPPPRAALPPGQGTRIDQLA